METRRERLLAAHDDGAAADWRPPGRCPHLAVDYDGAPIIDSAAPPAALPAHLDSGRVLMPAQ